MYLWTLRRRSHFAATPADGAGTAPATQSRPLPIVRVTGRGVWRGVQGLANLAVLVLFYLLYHHISASVPRDTTLAHAHAAKLISLEQRLHLLTEPRIQHWALHHAALPLFGGLLGGDAVRHAAIVIYRGGHLPWLSAMLVWLYLFRYEHFARVRNVAIVSTLLAIAVAALYPVAPPRFTLAGAPYGVENTTGLPIPEQTFIHLVSYDPYAAMPSVHTLWALLTALGLYLATCGRLGRMLAAIFPMTIVLIVVVTGNHYFLDCIASATLLIVCLLLQWIWERTQPHLMCGAARRASGRERKRGPNPRSLDQPLVFCACAGMILIVSTDVAQRDLGLALFAGSGVILAYARRKVFSGEKLCENAEILEWWCGLLFVLGATIIGANEHLLRILAALLWLVACLSPLLAHTIGTPCGSAERGPSSPEPHPPQATARAGRSRTRR